MTRAVVEHGARAVVVRMRFADLRRVGEQLYAVDLRTPERDYRLDLSSEPDARAGRHRLSNDGSGEIIRCRGLKPRIDYAQDVLTLRTPRGCLDTPRWVRARTWILLIADGEDTAQYHFDNPRNDLPVAERFTPKLFRGYPRAAGAQHGSAGTSQGTSQGTS